MKAMLKVPFCNLFWTAFLDQNADVVMALKKMLWLVQDPKSSLRNAMMVPETMIVSLICVVPTAAWLIAEMVLLIHVSNVIRVLGIPTPPTPADQIASLHFVEMVLSILFSESNAMITTMSVVMDVVSLVPKNVETEIWS
jgi:hypothetical protein